MGGWGLDTGHLSPTGGGGALDKNEPETGKAHPTYRFTGVSV